MKRIYAGSITSYSQFGHIKVPKSIKCECPGCRKKVEFVLKANYQTSKQGLLTESVCPLCKYSAPFIIMTKEGLGEKDFHPDVYIYDPSTSTHPLNQIEQLPNIPDELIRAYKSAVNVHHSKENSATAVLAKRVMENILKHFLLEKSNGLNLQQQFESLPENINLVKPVTSLSHLMATEGSLYRMLELETDLDDEMAELIMDLLENLIQYLFILPGNIEITHDKIEKKLS